jgi:hypothetical protein
MSTFEDDFNALAGDTAVDEKPAEVQNETPAEEPREADLDAEPPIAPPSDAGEMQADAGGQQAPASGSDPAPVEAKPPRLEDVLALLPTDKADIYKALIEQAARDQHRLRSDDGRVAAMQKLYHESAARVSEAEARMRELEERAKQPMTKAEAADLKAEIADEQDTLQKEFPEIADAVNVRIEKLLKARLGDQPATKPAEPVAPKQPAPTDADPPEVANLAGQYAALGAAHPDWQQAVASPVYQSWKQAQGPEVQRLIESNAADDAIRVLDRFKLDLAAVRRRQELSRKTENRARLEQQVGVKGTPPRVTQAPDDFEAAFNFFAEKKR